MHNLKLPESAAAFHGSFAQAGEDRLLELWLKMMVAGRNLGRNHDQPRSALSRHVTMDSSNQYWPPRQQNPRWQAILARNLSGQNCSGKVVHRSQSHMRSIQVVTHTSRERSSSRRMRLPQLPDDC